MTSALLAAVLLLCAAAATHDPGVAAAEAQDTTSDDAEVDDEGDFAPFMIVLEHSDGWRCAGSLVSLRTALTSAWCARGRGAAPARELWALAAGAAALPPYSDAAMAARIHGARRVARVAVSTGADAEMIDGLDALSESSWRGGAMDLALVELEEPFGSGARTQPILMATSAGECSGGTGGGGAQTQCHVSRAAPGRGSRAALHVVSAHLAPPETCARAANYWNAVQDRALCLVGPELCPSDWGGGVVCDGKLCGVLSRSVRATNAGGAGGGVGNGASDDCGDTHAAQSVSHWRRFLHCAHTLRACGPGGDCPDLCLERRLLEEPGTPAPATEAPTKPSTKPAKHSVATKPPAVLDYPTRTTKPRTTQSRKKTTQARTETTQAHEKTTQALTAVSGRRSDGRSHGKPKRFSPVRGRTRVARPRSYAPMLAANTVRAPTTPPPLATPARASLPELEAEPVAGETAVSLRPSFEFEPNRADFKASSPSTRAYLKAGEYGDNAADYGGEEPVVPSRTEPQPVAATDAGTGAGVSPASAREGAGTRGEGAAVPAPERRAAPAASVRVKTSCAHSVTFNILVPFICFFMTVY